MVVAAAAAVTAAVAVAAAAADVGAVPGWAAPGSADLGFSGRSPSLNRRKSTESRIVLAVSRNSRTGSSTAALNSFWNDVDIRFTSP